MACVIGFILFGKIFCECVFYYDLVENVIIDNLKNGFECEFKKGMIVNMVHYCTDYIQHLYLHFASLQQQLI